MDVSVIIPVYNVELYLQECLDSVLNQSGCSFEVICIDDGSTDFSSQILQTVARKDPRILIITQENKGQGHARNRGLDIASGRYVYFMDADDVLKADTFASLIALCDSKHLDHVIFGAEVFVDDRNGVIPKEQIRNTENYYKIKDGSLLNLILKGDTLFKRLIDTSSFYVSPQLRFIRRDLLEQNRLRFLEGVIHEDNYFAPLALMAADRAMVVPDKYCGRRLRGGSIMTASGTDIRHAAGCLAVVIKLKTAFGQFNVSKAETAEAINSYLTFLLERGEAYFSQAREAYAERLLVRELEKTCSVEEMHTLQWLVLPLLRQVNAANARAQKYRDKRISSRLKRFFGLQK